MFILSCPVKGLAVCGGPEGGLWVVGGSWYKLGTGSLMVGGGQVAVFRCSEGEMVVGIGEAVEAVVWEA